MANTKKLSPANTGFFRNAAEPYTINLTGRAYILSGEMLKDQTDPRVQRKRGWYSSNLDFISFENSELKLLNSYAGYSYELTVSLHPSSLQLSCSCGLEVETLCVHIYKVLEKLTWFDETSFFRNYQPGGIVEIATRYPRYFTKSRLDINPKHELNTVYQISGKLNLENFKQSLSFQGSGSLSPGLVKETALTYIIVDTYRNELFPFLLPCLGYLDKAGTLPKGFDSFISGTQKQYDSLLTEEQRTLNSHCYEMWRLAQNLPGSLLNEPVDEPSKLHDLFDLWQQAIPLLYNQSFIYTYCMFWKRELKHKPEKRKLERVEISPATPSIRFLLLDRGDIFQLHIRVFIKEQVLESYCADHLFFIKSGEQIHLLSSLKDAAVIEWMDSCNNCITVFKEHFVEFEQEILVPLRENYPVKMVNSTPLRIANKKEKNNRK